MRWYYEKKELRNTPSIQAGMDNETESRYRREGARFVIDIGSTMNLSLTTMATGVVYFHRFYMFHTFQDFPRYPTALACLFLAGKVEETPKKCKDMLKVARESLTDEKFVQFGTDPHQKSEEVMTLERIILQTIKFDLHVEHPYTYLLKYAKCLKGDKSRLQKMVQMAWTFVNDSLCTTLCLQWEPEIVAIALMHLAGKLSKFEVVDWNCRNSDHFRWWDMFVEDMTIELLEDICHQVLDLYSQTQNQAQTDSPPPTAGTNRPPGQHPHPPSPLNNTSNPQGGSKNSTPVAVMPPVVPQSQSNYPGGPVPIVPPQAFSYTIPSHLTPHVMGGYAAAGNPPLTLGFPLRTSSVPTPPLPPGYPPIQTQQYFAPPPPLPPSNRTHQPPPPPK